MSNTVNDTHKHKGKSGITYRLLLMNSASHTIIKALKFTRGEAAMTVACTIVGLLLLFYCIIAFTPLRTTIPGYPGGPTKKLAVENALKIDSLESEITRWNLYAENLSRVLAREATVNFESLVRFSSQRYLSEKSMEELQLQDSLLREEVRKNERFGIGERSQRSLPVEGMHFFTPVKGTVEQGFSTASHPYIELSVPSGAVVSAVLDGTLIYTAREEGTGIVAVLQHSDNVVSVYKGCSQLLKRSGDIVKAGTPLGNAGTGTDGKTTVIFELWHDGTALDASKYISF